MLQMTWTHETPCPLCGTAVVWTMTGREHSEVKAQLDRDPERGTWRAECSCGGCKGGLLGLLRAQEAFCA